MDTYCADESWKCVLGIDAIVLAQNASNEGSILKEKVPNIVICSWIPFSFIYYFC